VNCRQRVYKFDLIKYEELRVRSLIAARLQLAVEEE
jgi:hypothetical protein